MKAKSWLGVVVFICALGVAPASAWAGSISGTVTDAETGAPLTDVTVCVHGENGGGYCVGVPANGEYKIDNLSADEYRVGFRANPGNNYVMQYWPGGYGWYDATLIDLGAEEDRTGIDAALSAGGEVSGTVVGEGDIGPIEEVMVCARELEAPEYEECTQTDAAGEYLIDGRRLGPYRLTFKTPYSEVEYETRYYDEKRFEQEADDLELEAGMPVTANATLTPAGAVEGTITGEGEPLEWAWVCAYTLAEVKLACAPTDEDGRYRYRGLATGSYVLEVEGYGFMPEFSGNASSFAMATPVAVAAGETTQFDADLSAPPGIQGIVTAAASGEPLESVRVCAVPDSIENQTSCVYSWEDGTYRIDGLGAGDYTVSFEGDAWALQYYDGVTAKAEATKVSVGSGMVAGIDAELVPGGSIEGHITLASSGANLGSVKACALRADGSEAGCDTTLSSTGIFEIESIPVGEYKVRFTRSSYVTQFFNGKATFEAADPVTVTQGEMTEDVDAAMAKLEKPKNTTPPVLTGVGKVGETLSCSSGSWEGSPTVYEYWWYRDGNVIPPAEASTWKLVSADAGKTITCKVEAGNSAGLSAKVQSSNSIQVAAIRQLNVTKAGSGAGTVTSNPAGIDCGSTCATSGNEGETVTLTAAPAQHSQLSGWTGCTSSNGNECTVTLGGANASVTATFAPVTHTVSVAVTGGGSVSVASGAIAGCTASAGTCAGPYDEASEVVLTATPNAHQSFSGWTGCTIATGTECRVTVDGAENVTASFAPITHGVSVAVTGNGSVSAASGAIAGCTRNAGTCSGSYDEGTEVVLTATPAAHQSFSGWSGCTTATGTECKVTVDGAESVTATFAPIEHIVSVGVIGDGSVSAASGLISGCTASAGTCTGYYDEASEVVLTATPGAHQSFIGWTGCATSTGTECRVTVEETENVSATFEQITHELSVAKSGSGSGVVTSAPSGIDCGALCAAPFDEGEEVTLTAAPAADSEFSGWSGGACTGTGPCVITLAADTAVTATFAKKPAEGGTVVPPPTPPTPGPTPKPKPKPLKCKKGFKKKKMKGKQRCVKVKKKQGGKRS